MICRHKLNHFTVANTCFAAPLTRRSKTKFATVKWFNLWPANYSITNVLYTTQCSRQNISSSGKICFQEWSDIWRDVWKRPYCWVPGFQYGRNNDSWYQPNQDQNSTALWWVLNGLWGGGGVAEQRLLISAKSGPELHCLVVSVEWVMRGGGWRNNDSWYQPNQDQNSTALWWVLNGLWGEGGGWRNNDSWYQPNQDENSSALWWVLYGKVVPQSWFLGFMFKWNMNNFHN